MILVAKANQSITHFADDERGQLNVSGAVIGGLIVFSIAIFVAAAILPGAIDSVFDANTTGWDAGTVALWTIVPLVVVAGVLLMILRMTGVVGGRGEG